LGPELCRSAAVPDHRHHQRRRPAVDLAGGAPGMITRRGWRRAKSRLMVGLMMVAVIAAMLPLFLILASLIRRGAGSLSWSFFSHSAVPVGELGGGVLHAL